MSVSVSKSSPVVVRPSSEPATSTAGNLLKLSSYDKNHMCIPVTMFLVFDNPINEPAETIKSALSQALVPYLPFSGRLAAENNAVHITFGGDDQGVSFVAAAASCGLKEVDLSDRSSPLTSTLLDELAVYYPAAACGFGDPLLLMQVTEFTCGGFVVGVTWNHVIADAAGMGQFLRAVGERARGLTLASSVVPVRWDAALKAAPPAAAGFVELMMGLKPMADVAILDVTVPSRLIGSVKDAFRRRGKSPCTTFEAVAAVLWRCRTRAILSGSSSDSSEINPVVALYFTVNARKYAGAREGYYGNCLTGRFVVATGGTVANGDLVDVVEMIRRAKEQIPEQFKEGAGIGNGNDGVRQQQVNVDGLVGYNLFIVTCWRNLGVDEADFGGGRPARVTSHTRQEVTAPACVACPPFRGNDGANVLSGCVRKEHADAFLAELALSSSTPALLDS